ncbi:MAG: DNA-directed RNA polymerase subunit beta [Eubacteriaceae bacterium]|nr:DNA-directed RNA polymerase subunit beta [Eubacteriaceae bacterium]
MVNPERIGNRTRMSFSRIKDVMPLPYLIELQKSSYNWFLNRGLREVFDDINPISDFSGNLFLEFVDYSMEGEPKYSVEECKERDANYSASLKIKIRLTNKQTGEVKESSIFMADFPLMTNRGTFIINGAERVVVSQLVRSPSAYFSRETDKHGKDLYSSQIIPNRGAWLEFETDSNNILYVRVDRTRKIPITVLARSLGLGTNTEIIDYFGETDKLLATLAKDAAYDEDTGLTEIYKKLRPGEPASADSARPLFNSMFFDPKRYDLMLVGRYKLNKKLSIATRIAGHTSAETLISPLTGEVLAEKGETFTEESAKAVQNAGINRVRLELDDGKTINVIGNNTVDPNVYGLPFDTEGIDTSEMLYLPELKKILESEDTPQQMRIAFIDSNTKLLPRTITADDVFASINYNIGLDYGVGEIDDIDHLGNRRLRSVGELLQNQFRIGLSRLERVVRERMATSDPTEISPTMLVNIRPVSASLKEFFGSSQLSQFMDQTNPLTDLTHKRRLSALGPGGLSRERAGFDVRDVHHSHYGRICPIETPEGPNIGLIGSMSTYSQVNKYGFIETPYRKVVDGKVTKELQFLAADEEGRYTIAQANEPLSDGGDFLNDRITGRAGKNRDFVTVPASEIDYMDVSPRQIVSVATSLIPFLENDDANRALMGANMQRQAVPLLQPEAPVVGTGIEYRAALDSGVCIIAEEDGIVEKVTSTEIVVANYDKTERQRYGLLKFKRSNQGTCINQRSIVTLGQQVKKGDIIADGPSTDNGDLALGRNVLVGFMTWEGYNFEDAILISEELVRDDVYTSIHIEEFEAEARETKLGPEEMTREIPNVGEDSLKNLDSRGIIRIGAEVTSDDILVGKVTPKGESELSAEERLLRAIFGEKAREVRDTSLKVPHGESGIVVDVKVFTREAGDELKPGVNKLVRVYVAVKRKISVGDKMAGRHGNKGVISRILPVEDMPFLPDGTPLQIVLSPLGVPSRMNIGQVLEVHLGLACRALGWEVATPVFDGANEEDIMELLEQAGFDASGKIDLYDGRSGEKFANPVTVGYMYMLKLHHLVDDKMHSRSTGPYSLVTQQPLGGKAQFGGQRFGEMEVWALEAYGASNVLQEILTVKSDDITGRVKAYEAIIKGENIPEPGIPESFKVLMKEFQSLCLDINVLNENGDIVDLVDDSDLSPTHIMQKVDNDIATMEYDDDFAEEAAPPPPEAQGTEALLNAIASSIRPEDDDSDDLLDDDDADIDLLEDDDDDDIDLLLDDDDEGDDAGEDGESIDLSLLAGIQDEPELEGLEDEPEEDLSALSDDGLILEEDEEDESIFSEDIVPLFDEEEDGDESIFGEQDFSGLGIDESDLINNEDEF